VPLALSTGHQVGLAVTAAVFIAFALASSFLFPRFRPQFPGGGLPAFIVVSFLFFFAMLAAVEVFGAEDEVTQESERAAQTVTEAEPRVPPTTVPTTTAQQPTTTQATTTQPTTTQPTATTVPVTENEFTIVLPSPELEAGEITFNVKNEGKLPHDLAIKGMKEQTKLIPAGGSAELTVTLKAGDYELWCTVPGHEAAGMKLEISVS
jgi:cytoskeletal protein RodZ